MWNVLEATLLDRPVGPIQAVLRRGAFVLICVMLASCDLDVSNPGPIQDRHVGDPGAHEAIVNGAMRGALSGLNGYARYGGGVVREFQPGAHTGSGGVPRDVELGKLSDEWTADGGWESAHMGRWVGENMFERFRTAIGPASESYAPLGRLYLWTGFANRTLGEHVCTAVFDSGRPEPYLNHFTRAVEQLTQAERIAAAADDETTRLAAIAFRASAHLHLRNFQAAAEDASRIPFDFNFQAPYNPRNPYSYVGAANMTFRSLTFWSTVFENYFPDTGDPRVAWGFDPNVGHTVSRITYLRIIPMYYPLKTYAPRSPDELTRFAPIEDEQARIPVNLATGREMVLIRAEAALEQGDWPGGMALINQVRTSTRNYFSGEPLEPVMASNSVEAWTALKFERYVELNMEGRRMGDRKRWAVSNTPGALHPKEFLPDELVQRFGVPKEVPLCFPMARAEKEAHPAIPATFTEVLIRDK